MNKEMRYILLLLLVLASHFCEAEMYQEPLATAGVTTGITLGTYYFFTKVFRADKLPSFVTAIMAGSMYGLSQAIGDSKGPGLDKHGLRATALGLVFSTGVIIVW